MPEKQWQGRHNTPGLRQPCGTPAAARRHYRHGEKPCQRCLEAGRRDKNTRKAATSTTIHYLHGTDPACNHTGEVNPARLTTDPAEVTCGQCKIRRSYRAAVA